MTARERHQRRDKIARANGYKPRALPADVEYAGVQLPEAVDVQAASAALRLRGLPGSQAERHQNATTPGELDARM